MGLRLKLLITLAGVLFICTLMMIFVMSYLYQQSLLPSVSQKALLISNLIIASQQESTNSAKSGPAGNLSRQSIVSILERDSCLGVYIGSPGKGDIFSYAKDPKLYATLKASAERSLKSGTRHEIFYGSTWRGIWQHSQILICSQPVANSGESRVGASVAFSLRLAMEQMQKVQKIALLYLIINTVLFTAIGFSPLYRFTIKPLRKLTQRASQYRFGDGLLLAFKSSGSEWDSLYRAVNRIVALNTEDNKKLKETVQSLQLAMGDLKEAQQEIIRAEKLASVGRLSSGLAHEIGNPIGIVIGYVELMKGGTLSQDEVADILRRVEMELRRVDRIIRQMLDFSRAKKADVRVVSIHEIICDLLEMAKVQPLFSGIAMHVDLAAEEDGVLADAEQLRQAFLNIMINAVDAIEIESSGRRGRLIVSSRNPAEKMGGEVQRRAIEIFFKDNGVGMRPDCVESIFDPFFTTKPPKKGCGLGLWVAMMIVEGVGGNLSVESREGVGTTMSIRLPIRR